MTEIEKRMREEGVIESVTPELTFVLIANDNDVVLYDNEDLEAFLVLEFSKREDGLFVYNVVAGEDFVLEMIEAQVGGTYTTESVTKDMFLVCREYASVSMSRDWSLLIRD